jgi:SAM-dependent methyltransferase
LYWADATAQHEDRHWFTGVDPQENDLPEEIAAALEKVGAGGMKCPEAGTAEFPLSDPVASLQVRVTDASPEPAAGFLPILYALKSAISARRAAAPQLADLREPYARPEADDTAFYAQPRLVDHLDATALSHWRKFTGRFVKEDMAVLDLMASHDSHLPPQVRPASLTGLGMNATELEANSALTRRIVHDLNANPALPCAAASFDLVLCALSIEYLERPEVVLRDVTRVLKPGGTCVISFSERWFPPKAVLPWPTLPSFVRQAWVLRHLQRVGFQNLHTASLRGYPRPPDDKYILQTRLADPLYAVWGST